MALNKDFRIKSGLLAGKNDLGVSIDTTGKILSAGTDLFDLFATGATTAGDLTFGSGLSGTSDFFDGALNVTVALSSRLVADSFVGNLSGKASSAEVLATARTISLGQDVTGSASFDGSQDITINATVNSALYSNGNSAYTTVNASSASWNSTYTTVNAQSAANAAVYSSYNTQSATLVNTGSSPSQGTVRLTQQNGNTIDIDTGLQTGDSPQFAGLTVDGNTTVTGNLSVLGDFTYLDTTVSVTSALSVINAGTGPAIYIEQSGVQPIATFVDKEGGVITFADTGAVGIGTNAPGEKLSVVGNISASGNITVGGTATIGSLATGTGDAVVTQESGTLKTRNVDARVWGSTLVDSGAGLTTNAVPKATDANTIGDSSITDNGTIVDIAATTTKVNTASAETVSIYNGSNFTQQKYFVATVQDTGTAVSTFSVTNLNGAKFTVMLSVGNNRTAFEVLVTTAETGASANGTVYAIVDNQVQSQLADIDAAVSGGNLVLTITSFAADTKALIEGVGFYNALNA